MFKKMRERKGFTLAELLIVVAIIGVLVAIAIPIFTSQLEKSRDAVSAANARAAYAEAAVAKLNQEDVGNAVYNDDGTVTVSGVLIKGETETESGKAFQSGGSFALPFTVPEALAKALDKKPDSGTTISIKFTWGTDDKCAGAVG